LTLQILNGAEISTTTKGPSDGRQHLHYRDGRWRSTIMRRSNGSTVGSGQAGNISITVQDTVELFGSYSIAVPAASRDGGNITISAGSLVYLHDSSLSANAGDNGGNIKIDPIFLVLNQSSITANAVNNNGGTWTSRLKYFLNSAVHHR